MGIMPPPPRRRDHRVAQAILGMVADDFATFRAGGERRGRETEETMRSLPE